MKTLFALLALFASGEPDFAETNPHRVAPKPSVQQITPEPSAKAVIDFQMYTYPQFKSAVGTIWLSARK